MPTVETKVYDRTSGALLTSLANAEGRGWQEVLNETGSGQVTLGLGDADLAHLVEGNIVRCFIDGTAAFSWVVGPMGQTTVAAAEEAEEERTVNGRGTLSVFSEAIVYPEVTSALADFPPLADRKPLDTRRFDYTSPLFDSSPWPLAVEVPAPASLAGGLPNGWPGADAEWIWDALPDGSNNNPTGDIYIRHVFTLAAATRLTFYMTCDDGFEFFLDGELILSDLRTPYLQLLTRSVTTELVAGNHVIAVRAVNGPGAGSDNPGAFAMTAIELDGNGDPLTPLEWTSDVGWYCVGYPPEPPGMTVGRVLIHLVNEAQARGALPGVTVGFTADLDSSGAPWPEVPSIALKIGTNYLDVLAQLTEAYVDVAMDPGSLRLDAWAERGTASGATLGIGTNLLGLTHRGGDHQTVTAVVGRYGDHWLEQTAGSGRRRESYMEVRDATSTAQAERLVDAAMASRSAPVVATTAAFEPVTGAVPTTNFKVGDTVTVPNPALAGAALRVMSLSVSETETDYDFAVELGSLDRSREERMALQLRKTGPAGLDWSQSANVQSAPNAGLGPEQARTLAPTDSARMALNDLSDVANVSATTVGDGAVLTWDEDLGPGGLWTPSASSLSDAITPTGAVTPFLTSTARPGWLYLDGSTFLEADYPDLFAELGGGTLPDWRDRFLVGAGTTYAGLATGGSADAVVVSHDHYTNVKPSGSELTGYGLPATASFQDRGRVDGLGDVSGLAGVSGTGANLPPYAAVFWFVKT